MKRVAKMPEPVAVEVVQCCATCHNSEMRDAHLDGKSIGQALACLKNPPQIVCITKYDEAGKMHIVADSRTPIVGPNDWRGCWEKKRPRT